MKRFGFTLIEMLVVVAIIGVLLGIMMPAVMRLREQARQRKAGVDKLALVNAIKAFHSEYDEWPLPSADLTKAQKADLDDPATPVIYTYGSNNVEIAKVLRPDHQRNPKGMLFLQEEDFSRRDRNGIQDPNGPLRDPWGTPYTIKMDIRYPGTMRLSGTPALIVSGVQVP